MELNLQFITPIPTIQLFVCKNPFTYKRSNLADGKCHLPKRYFAGSSQSITLSKIGGKATYQPALSNPTKARALCIRYKSTFKVKFN